MIGSLLAGRYKILEFIGQGGMGVVYRASIKDSGKSVAVKMLREEVVADRIASKRFEQEAQAIRRLNHPHVLKVYDFGATEDGRPFIVTEFIGGASLEFVLRELRYLPMGLALRIFAQAASGLAHAHKQGVIHRDLKPSNLMLVYYAGEITFVKIVDFGIAELAFKEDAAHAESDASNQTQGSPLYMSPEQCKGEDLDIRSDIYSLGCVIYRSICGVAPFSGKDLRELLNKHINEMPQSCGEVAHGISIPPEVNALIFKAIAKNKNDRYQSMDELQEHLLFLGQSYADDSDLKIPRMRTANTTSKHDTTKGAASDPDVRRVNSVSKATIKPNEPLEDTGEIKTQDQ